MALLVQWWIARLPRKGYGFHSGTIQSYVDWTDFLEHCIMILLTEKLLNKDIETI